MHVLIIGGGYAGVVTALRLSRKARKAGRRVEITLVNDSDMFVERIRLHQAASGQALRVRPLRPLLARAGVELVVGHATAMDPVLQTLTVGDRLLGWDRLVVALGSRAGKFDVPGSARFALGINPGSVEQLTRRLSRLGPGSRVVVVGGGLTGIEAATEIRESHPNLAVTLATRAKVAAGWSPAARQHFLRTFEAAGIELIEDVDVREVAQKVIHTDRGDLSHDLVVWTAGFEMPSLPRAAGLAVNAMGQVLADPQLRSISHPHVYAAGDITGPVLDPGQKLPLGCKSALPLGAQVADNLFAELTGAPLAAFDYAVTLFCVSLGRRNGLIQFPSADGSLTGGVIRGRLGGWIKEFICRSTWWSLLLESRGINGAVWARTGKAPEALESGSREVLGHVRAG